MISDVQPIKISTRKLSKRERAAAERAATAAVAQVRQRTARNTCVRCGAKVLRRHEQSVLGSLGPELVFGRDPLLAADRALRAYLIPVDADDGRPAGPVAAVGGGVAVHLEHQCPAGTAPEDPPAEDPPAEDPPAEDPPA